MQRAIDRLFEELGRRIGKAEQQDLAAELGVSQSYISRLVSGERAPGRQLVRAVADRHPDLLPLVAAAIAEAA